MADLVAIGYDEETTAVRAEREIERLSDELGIEPDAAAVIIRDGDGNYRVQTNHHAVGAGMAWGMVYDLLFGMLFFAPVFGMSVGSGLSALMDKVERIGIDHQFASQVREMLQPGTSALFFVVADTSPDEAMEVLSAYGGTMRRSPMLEQATMELQNDLHGRSAGKDAAAPSIGPTIYTAPARRH